MGYDAAAADCTGADAWTCIARTVEETSYRRAGGDGGGRGSGGDRRNGGEDGGTGGDLFEEQDEDSDEPVEAEEALELTVMRCVRLACVNSYSDHPKPRVIPPRH